MDIIKISLLGICGVILGFFLKETRPEYGGLVTLGIGVMILGLAVGKIQYIFEVIEKLKDSLPVDGSYVATLIRDGGNYLYWSVFCRDMQGRRASGNGRTD